MNLKTKDYSRLKIPFFLHLVAWIIVLLFLWLLFNSAENGDKSFLYHIYLNLIVYGTLFYLNYFWLVPNFFFKDKKRRYFIIALSIYVILCSGTWFINEYHIFNEKFKFEPKAFEQKDFEHADKNPPPGREFKGPPKPPSKPFVNIRHINFLITSFLLLGFSFGIRLLEKVNNDEKIRKELEKEKLNSELAFLKNQISPHFFFNTLNNIYSLIEIDTERARESIIKLSKLMRYLLYDSEKGELKLNDELKFLINYIDLMKLRLSNKVQLSVSFPEDYTNHTIPPLLFVPFIENAFKHGVSYRASSYI